MNLFASDRVLLNPAVSALVLLREGNPVAAGHSFATAHSHGIHWVATVPEQCQLGHGTRITEEVIARCPPGSPLLLQSTPAGFTLYRKLGFSHHGFLERWITP
ncbi:MAG: hypothetical protein Q4D96_06865 [Propionibacteriaceae bacterium]|nr:hypothetical protein [Propionibacteriaceae bacterium]